MLKIFWTGLQSLFSAKERFLARIDGKIRHSPHAIKNIKKTRYASKLDKIGYQENVLRT